MTGDYNWPMYSDYSGYYWYPQYYYPYPNYWGSPPCHCNNFCPRCGRPLNGRSGVIPLGYSSCGNATGTKMVINSNSTCGSASGGSGCGCG